MLASLHVCACVFVEPEVNVGNLPQCVVFIYDAYVCVWGDASMQVCTKAKGTHWVPSSITIHLIPLREPPNGKVLLSRLATH